MYDDLGGVHRLDSHPLTSEIPVLSSQADTPPFSEFRCAAIALHKFWVLALTDSCHLAAFLRISLNSSLSILLRFAKIRFMRP